MIHWSIPASGSDTNVEVDRREGWPYDKNGKLENKLFDCVAPDPFLDENGVVWVVVSMGFWGLDHEGCSSWDDVMKPYLVKVPVLNSGKTLNSVPQIENSVEGENCGIYRVAVPINLPKDKITDERDKVRKGEDRIDGSLYKESGVYYLLVKRYGTVIELWSTKSLETVSDPNTWTLISPDILTGFEGPCLTKYGGQYYVYVDKLADYPPGKSDGKTGIHMTCAKNLKPGTKWKGKVKVNLWRRDKKKGVDVPCVGRHGTVRTITDANAIKQIMALYESNTGKKYNSAVDKPTPIIEDGWFYANGKSYMYKNGALLKSCEWCDAGTGAWYWFDADGTMARNKDVFIPYTADRSEGKWVYYDEEGKMVKGQHYHDGHWEYYDLTTMDGGYWYYYDTVTGERATGFVDLPKSGNDAAKRVYYDSNGRMVYGEKCINGNWYRFDDYTGAMLRGEYCSSEGNWYRFDTVTGIMIHGEYCSLEGNWYYYDSVTGIMQKGWVTLPDGRRCYYDEVTGIRRG